MNLQRERAATRTWIWVVIAMSATPIVSCGSSSTSPSQATTNPLHVDVTDPSGDARPLDGLARSPDFIRGAADVGNGTITFTVRFATGTFDPATTLVIIELDVDQNPSTGQSDSGLGADYLVSLGSGFGAQALVGHYAGSLANFTPVGNASVTTVTDGMDVTVPLSLLGNDDGRLDFRMIAFSHVAGSPTSGGLDWMPDTNLPGARIQ
jgi:hypothetical protein